MRVMLSVGAALALVASVLLLRIVLHRYTEHGDLDVFHLLVAIVAASAGLFLLLRASRGTAA